MSDDATRWSAAVVALSGGQDSTTALAWARHRCHRVYTVAFDYGQRHRVELDAARRIAALAEVTEHRELPVSSLAGLGGNALTAAGAIHVDGGPDGLPTTFVPGRNLIFLTLAAAWAYQLGVSELVTGVCQTDYSGYPDCRETTMRALEHSLRLGMERPFTIHTPLMHRSKAEAVLLAREEGALPWLAWSHTCYEGQVPPCGRCPACVLRARGFAEVGIDDPLLLRLAAIEE